MTTLLPLATITDIGGIKTAPGSAVVVDAFATIGLTYDAYWKVDLQGSLGAAAATGTDAIALGSGAQALHDGSVAVGSGACTVAPDSFAVGTPSARLRRITGVKDAVDSADAATLGQVKSLLQGVPGQGVPYLAGSITGALTFSKKPLLSWVIPCDSTLTDSMIKVASVLRPSGTNLRLDLMYRDPMPGAADLPVAAIQYMGDRWMVFLGVEQKMVVGGVLWIMDASVGDTGFLSIGISISTPPG